MSDANSIAFDSYAAYQYDGLGGSETIYARTNNTAGYFGYAIVGPGSLTPLPAM